MMGGADEQEGSGSDGRTTTDPPEYGTVVAVTSETGLRHATETSAAEAAQAAQSVADHAGVRVAELHDVAELAAAAALYQDVWQTETRTAPVSPDLMRALSHAGGYVAGAY